MLSLIGKYVGLEKDRLFRFRYRGCCLSSLATDSPGQLDVFGHDGDPLGVDCHSKPINYCSRKSVQKLLQVPIFHDSRAGYWV